MNTNLSKTLLSYRDALYVDGHRKGPITQANKQAVFALATDLSQLGYTLSNELISTLVTFSPSALKKFHADSVALIKAALGADVKYAPLFRKFPDEIPDRSVVLSLLSKSYGFYAEVLYLAIFVEWSSDDYNGTWFGRQFPGVTLEEVIDRPELVSSKPLKVLKVATDKDVAEVFRNLVSAKGSISDTDKAFVEAVVLDFADIAYSSLPDEIPNKENLTFLLGAISKGRGLDEAVRQHFLPYMKTASDILRAAASFSGSDVSLAEHTRFKLSNSQRRFVLEALDALNYESATEDMLRFHGLWLVLSKYLHVNAYADKYPNATKMVQAIRNAPNKISTFNRKVEEILLFERHRTPQQIESFIKLLKSRPGDFARRLDHVLRVVNQKDSVVKAFLSVADKVASPLLLNLATHMFHRSEKAGVRVFMPKGSTTNATVIRGDGRTLLDDNTCYQLSAGISDVLVKRYAEKGNLGKVLIDRGLGDILVPTSMRNVSESLKTVARGSKFSIGKDDKIVRMFLYWEDQKSPSGYSIGRVDVDLSLQLLTADFRQNGVISYYNLSGSGLTHSGDFTSAPNGAAEFIDVDIEKVLQSERGTRYVAVTVNSYSGQAFNTFTAKAGYMVRDGVSGKSFEAKSVEQKFDVTAGTKFAVPMLLDLVERKVIWLDVGLVDTARMFTNVGKKGADLTILSQYAAEMYREKANLLDLLLLHTKGRAESVSFTREPNVQYDTVFDMSFAYRVDEILSEWI